MRNIHDVADRAPSLRVDLNLGTLNDLPAHSRGPRPGTPEQEVLQTVREAGYRGVQGGDPELCRRLGLRRSDSGRVDEPADAERIAALAARNGDDCVTLHVGRGFEDDARMDVLAQAILQASERHNIPLYVETHRATMTQDMWRTLRLIERFPELRFNGDFSHWYTGLEMVYGDFTAKLDTLAPFFQRVRFIHGRIGNSGCMQIDIGEGQAPSVAHFREMWIRSFEGFLATAKRGDIICFAPELLQPGICYARVFPNSRGELVEEGDRWQQALLYSRIASECFAEAQRRTGKTESMEHSC